MNPITPADSYREAFNSHRHYDNMANAVVALACVAIGTSIALALNPETNKCFSMLIPLFTSIILFLCTRAYKRFDSHAALALNIASAIELGDDRFNSSPIGFATVFESQDLYLDLKPNAKGRTLKTVLAIGYILATLALTAFILSIFSFISQYTFLVIANITT